MRVAAVQFAYDDATDEARLERACDLVRAQQGADLVVLPELWPVGAFRTGRWPERAETVDGPTVQALSEAATDVGAVVHVGSIIERDEHDRLHNTAVVVGPDGARIAVYRKIHRFAAGGREAELLEPGQDIVVIDLPLRDGSTLRTGLSTCYDLRFPELYRAQSAADDAGGAELFVVPASWPKIRRQAWGLLLAARAAENQCAVVGVNAVGLDGKAEMGGHSVVLDAWGEPLAQAGEDETVLTCEIDLDEIREARRTFPVLDDRVL